MLTQTIAQDKYNIYGSETIEGSFFMFMQFKKLVSTFFQEQGEGQKNYEAILFCLHFTIKKKGKMPIFRL